MFAVTSRCRSATANYSVEPIPDVPAPPAEADDNPEARRVLRESIRLEFAAAPQYLPPRQRAVLLLTQVLNWIPMFRLSGMLVGFGARKRHCALYYDEQGDDPRHCVTLWLHGTPVAARSDFRPRSRCRARW